MSHTAHIKNETVSEPVEELSEPVTIGVEAYISEDYARAERDRLWRKVWQQVGRVEEIPEVGNYLTYDILDDSILIVRTAPDTIRAYHNVCSHRGRRLVDTPDGREERLRQADGSSSAASTAGATTWTAKCTHVPDKEDWKGALTDERTRLGEVKVDTWGGWIWINMDPDCEPLARLSRARRDHARSVRAAEHALPLAQVGRLRLQLEGRDGGVQRDLPRPDDAPGVQQVRRVPRLGQGAGQDTATSATTRRRTWTRTSRPSCGSARAPTRASRPRRCRSTPGRRRTPTRRRRSSMRRCGWSTSCRKERPADKVLKHWLESARRDDAARGVIWPTVDPAHVGKSGTAWQIFPNFQIGHAVNNTLCYSARPYGYDPDKCIFEAAVYELFPKGRGAEDRVGTTAPDDREDWCYVLPQDFSNMAAVQQGMKSRGFRGTQPNPYMERAIANLHRNLAKYMGTGAPQRHLKSGR